MVAIIKMGCNGVARGVMIASNLCLDVYLVKLALQAGNYVAKSVFKSTQPEQFVVTLMGKAPTLVNRFIHLLTWKTGGLAAVISVASLLFLWQSCDAIFGQTHETVTAIFAWTHPFVYIVSNDD